MEERSGKRMPTELMIFLFCATSQSCSLYLLGAILHNSLVPKDLSENEIRFQMALVMISGFVMILALSAIEAYAITCAANRLRGKRR